MHISRGSKGVHQAGPDPVSDAGARIGELLGALPEDEARDRRELRLRVALIVPLIAIHGFGSIEVERCAKRAKEVSDRLGDAEHRFSRHPALWNNSLLRHPVPETLAMRDAVLHLRDTPVEIPCLSQRAPLGRPWRRRATAVSGARAPVLELQRAIEISEAQTARLWQPRAATDLARLWRDHGRRVEARDLLAPIYGWFSDGFDALDLKEAKALLDELR